MFIGRLGSLCIDSRKWYRVRVSLKQSSLYWRHTTDPYPGPHGPGLRVTLYRVSTLYRRTPWSRRSQWISNPSRTFVTLWTPGRVDPGTDTWGTDRDGGRRWVPLPTPTRTRCRRESEGGVSCRTTRLPSVLRTFSTPFRGGANGRSREGPNPPILCLCFDVGSRPDECDCSTETWGHEQGRTGPYPYPDRDGYRTDIGQDPYRPVSKVP